jgi:hypothetical protein
MASVNDANDVTTTGSAQLIYTAPSAKEGVVNVRITPRSGDTDVSLFVVGSGDTQGNEHLVIYNETIPGDGTRTESGIFLEDGDAIYFTTNTANVTVHVNGYMKDV